MSNLSEASALRSALAPARWVQAGKQAATVVLQIAVLSAIWVSMDVLRQHFGWSLPAGLMGFALLAVGLFSGLVKSQWLQSGTNWLMGEMLLFFVPAMLVVTEYTDLIRHQGLRILVVIVIAVPIAMSIHRSMVVQESTWFLIEFLKPIPPVALIPLGLLIWGPTEVLKLILVIFASLWPLLTQLVYGLREVSGTALEVSRVYRFSPWQRTSRIVLPSILPFALTGLRISATIALIVAIVVEYIGGVSGLGQMLILAQLNGLLLETYAIIFAAGFLGLAFNGILAALSRPLLFWHASQREQQS